MANTHPRPSRRRFSLGRKAGLLFAFLGLALILLAVQNVRVLQTVRLDARKFMEETREAHSAQELLSVIEQLHLLARHPGDDGLSGERAVLLDRIEAHLLVLASGRPGKGDPSSSEHESAEQQILSELVSGLQELRRESAQPGTPVGLDLLWELEEAAVEVREETAEEAEHASADLQDRVRGLISVSTASALAAVVVLLLFFQLVHRHVVRPAQELRTGAMLFGRGHLEHRIGIDSADEFGELADEFNDMADRLTETHRDLEGRVRERTEEFVRAARLADLGTFAAGVAHEVNTPLASIASCAEGLERRLQAGTATPEEQVDYLQTIAQEAYRARDITARLLAFARQDRGPLSRVDVCEAVEKVAALVGHELARSELVLAVDCDEGLPLVEGNGAELEHVVLNLVMNARDASPREGVIHLTCRAEAGGVLLEVADQGPGVSHEDAGRIFDPFFTTKPPGEGTGLGLSIVFRIVESHGGSVEVLEAEGGGALFQVHLPAAADVAEVS